MSIAKETLGKIYTDLKSQYQQDKVDIFELVRVTQADFIPRLVRQIELDKHKTNNDFYVEACLRMNALMPDIPEVYFKSRHTCPTPFYDRSVFRYSRKEDRITMLWHLPSKDECLYYLNNSLILRDDEKEAAKYVFDYRDGTLLKLAKTLNGEINDYELTFYRKDQDGSSPITS